MDLEFIDSMSPEKWDEAVGGFATKSLFHESRWLDFHEKTQGGTTLRFAVRDGAETLGYFAALALKKGPLRILASPLPGSSTNHMGPAVGDGFDFSAFVDALEALCRRLKVHHVEIGHPSLSPGMMREKGYCVIEDNTYIVDLEKGEDLLWNGLKRQCRQNVKKALDKGLSVSRCAPGEFVEEYYAQLTEVFEGKGLVPTYPVGTVRALFDLLYPDNLFALQVRLEDEVAASGLFVHDERCVYALGAASWKRFRPLFPNELLFWSALTESAGMGIPRFDFCGPGGFKSKFGCPGVVRYKYAKGLSVMARLSREPYRLMTRARRRLLGKMRGMAGPGEARA